MWEESQPISSGTPPQSTRSTATFCSTTSQHSTTSVFTSIGKEAKGANEASFVTKDRSISHSITTVSREGHLLPAGYIGENTGDDTDNKSLSSLRMRKRDRFFNFFWSSNPEPKVRHPQSLNPKTAVHRLSITSTDTTLHRISTVSTEYSVDLERTVSNTEVQIPRPYVQPSVLSTNPRLDIFLQNVNAPVMLVALPEIGARIDTTPQLALCIGLLNNDNGAVRRHEGLVQMLSSDTAAQRDWSEAMKRDLVEQDRLRWLGNRIVEEFAMDVLKDSTEIGEIVFLGPVLEKDTYRRLLSCTIAAFDQSVLLDVDLLQGVVQLVQYAPSGSLLPDDLVKILRILRVRLQDTHQQSSVHPPHLTLAVSRLLDIMAEHKVKDLNHVEDHGPLSEILLGLKDSADPYLIYQACYAFQALQYVPDNETPLQAIFRHSIGVVGGLVKVTAVLRLDLSAIIEGLGKLQDVCVSTVGIATTVYEGVTSLMESGQSVFDSLREGLGFGQKHLWYPAIRAAHALVQAGQLKDLNQLIYQAPCRRDPLFQWGICQLLGEIASDTIWATIFRQQAIDLLRELYRNDLEWGQDESVKAWMLNIIDQLGTDNDQAVSTYARTLLKDLSQDPMNTAYLPYPLRNRLPLPASSPILARVQNVPLLEYDLHRHKVRSLQYYQQTVYIPPLAKPGLMAKDEDLVLLMEEVQEFLASERQVMLVLGDSGSGKSTFNRHLEYRLWTDYKQGGPIPLFINLPAIDHPDHDLIAKQLKANNFTDDQILEMKMYRQLILICDGYDESQQLDNLHRSNMLNKPGQWDTKMVISCRTQSLGPAYVDRFKPLPSDRYASGPQDLFQEAVIAPFSKDQVKSYVKQFVQDPQTALLFRSQSVWSAEEYMHKLTAIPNIMDLAKNPFLLTLALKALPGLVASNEDLESIQVTRVGLYDMFVDQWLENNRRRIQSNKLSQIDRETFSSMDDDFIGYGIDYLLRLAAAIFREQDGNPVVHYNNRLDRNSWKAEFFGNGSEARLLREASPFKRAGNQFRFVHRSVLEYFLSRVIYNPENTSGAEADSKPVTSSSASPSLDTNGPLFRRNLLLEPSIIQFLCDRATMYPDFEQQLRAVVDQSKTDASAAIAATNAITILVRSDVTFHGADFRDVKIPGADLSDGQFDSTQFQGADLRGVNLSRCWLRRADMSSARMKGAQFGELQYLEMEAYVHTCAYSPDGRMLALGLRKDGVGIVIYDTLFWTETHLIGSAAAVLDVMFSPNGQAIVYGGEDTMVRLWDCTNGQEISVMKGHSGWVMSVAFSPCGKQIASASNDKTVRLWDSHSGESLFVLEAHTDDVVGVRYSPDGGRLVSGGWDEMIRFWDPATGELEVVLKSSLGVILCLAYSPDGRWIVSGHFDGELQLWNTVTSEPGPILHGHTSAVKDVAFSPNSQLIVSASHDETVRLWDASTGTPVSILSGHSDIVLCVAFSPDGRQIASGSRDRKVRLRVTKLSTSKNFEVQCHIGSVWKVVYSPDGRSILSISDDRTIRQWDSLTGVPGSISIKCPKPLSIQSVALSPDGKQIAASLEDDSIRLWDIQTGAAGPILEGNSGVVCSIAFSPCSRWIVFSDYTKEVRFWDLENTEKPSILCKMTSQVHFVTVSSDGLHIALGTEDNTVHLLDRPSEVLLSSIKLEDDEVQALACSPVGQQIAIGTYDGTVKLWNLRSNKPCVALKGHRGAVDSIAYSPCGQWIASGSRDFSARLWHRKQLNGTESWSCVSIVRGFFESVVYIAWNPVVPMEFVTACMDGSIRVWRVSSGDGGVAVRMLWGPNFRILCAADTVLFHTTGLSPSNKKLLMQRGAVDNPWTHTRMGN